MLTNPPGAGLTPLWPLPKTPPRPQAVGQKSSTAETKEHFKTEIRELKPISNENLRPLYAKLEKKISDTKHLFCLACAEVLAEFETATHEANSPTTTADAPAKSSASSNVWGIELFTKTAQLIGINNDVDQSEYRGLAVTLCARELDAHLKDNDFDSATHCLDSYTNLRIRGFLDLYGSYSSPDPFASISSDKKKAFSKHIGLKLSECQQRLDALTHMDQQNRAAVTLHEPVLAFLAEDSHTCPDIDLDFPVLLSQIDDSKTRRTDDLGNVLNIMVTDYTDKISKIDDEIRRLNTDLETTARQLKRSVSFSRSKGRNTQTSQQKMLSKKQSELESFQKRRDIMSQAQAYYSNHPNCLTDRNAEKKKYQDETKQLKQLNRKYDMTNHWVKASLNAKESSSSWLDWRSKSMLDKVSKRKIGVAVNDFHQHLATIKETDSKTADVGALSTDSDAAKRTRRGKAYQEYLAAQTAQQLSSPNDYKELHTSLDTLSKRFPGPKNKQTRKAAYAHFFQKHNIIPGFGAELLRHLDKNGLATPSYLTEIFPGLSYSPSCVSSAVRDAIKDIGFSSDEKSGLKTPSSPFFFSSEKPMVFTIDRANELAFEVKRAVLEYYDHEIERDIDTLCINNNLSTDDKKTVRHCLSFIINNHLSSAESFDRATQGEKALSFNGRYPKIFKQLEVYARSRDLIGDKAYDHGVSLTSDFRREELRKKDYYASYSSFSGIDTHSSGYDHSALVGRMQDKARSLLEPNFARREGPPGKGDWSFRPGSTAIYHHPQYR